MVGAATESGRDKIEQIGYNEYILNSKYNIPRRWMGCG